MKKKNPEKGFTLIEILIVISIISILFMILIPKVNSYFIKSQETGIRTDFRVFQLASESYLKDATGKNVTKELLNTYLDSEHEISEDGSLLKTKSKDPWGNSYVVEIDNKKILFSSYGKDGETNNAYLLASYYYQGVTDSCTDGFKTNNIEFSNINNTEGFICGGDLVGEETPPTASLEAPANFNITNVSNSKATLSWDSVSGATSYIVKRNGTIIYTGSNLTYTDLTLSPGVTYTYSVAAKNDVVTSSYVSSTITTDAMPITPTGFKATKVTDFSALLSWNSVTDATGYILRRDGVIIYTGNSTSFGDAFLSDYTTYHYSLIATNSNGASAPASLTVKTNSNYETVKLPDIGTGSCSPYDPYMITTLGELQGVKLNLSACYELSLDIEANHTASWNNTKGFEPIGTGSMFSGEFDGKNYTISNLKIDRTTEENIGLFGKVHGIVENTKIVNTNVKGLNKVGIITGETTDTAVITNITVDGSVAGTDFVGGIVGFDYGGTLNHSSSNAIVNGNNRIGGVIGYNEGAISDVTSTATVHGLIGRIGGVAGENYKGDLTNIISNASLSGTSVEVGGVVGFNVGRVSAAESTSTLNITGDKIGGIVGYNHSLGILDDITSSASVTGSNKEIGGIAGYNSGTINNANTTISSFVKGASYVGGTAGYNSSAANLSNIVSAASVTGELEYIAGIVGYNNGSLNVADSNANVNSTGRYIGGVVGYNKGSSISVTSGSTVIAVGNEVGGAVGYNSGILRNITSTSSSSVKGTRYVGGTVGYNNGTGNIDTVTSNASVTAGNSDVGGVIGYNFGAVANATATSFVQVDINGAKYVGGVIGRNAGNLTNGTSSATVKGTNTLVGGVVGYNDGTSNNIESTSNAKVTGNEEVGGVVGRNEGTLQISKSAATITGARRVGGIVGLNFKIVNNATFSGKLTNTGDSSGGIAGYSDSLSAITNVSATNAAVVNGKTDVGGIIGTHLGSADTIHSEATVTGNTNVHILVGRNSGIVTNATSTP